MSSNNRNVDKDTDSTQNEGNNGAGKGTQTGPVAGGADNTRGENKPSNGGEKKGKEDQSQDSPQGSNANLTTTSRGADSTDKEFRNNQPNASTLKGHKSSEGLGNELD